MTPVYLSERPKQISRAPRPSPSQILDCCCKRRMTTVESHETNMAPSSALWFWVEYLCGDNQEWTISQTRFRRPRYIMWTLRSWQAVALPLEAARPWSDRYHHHIIEQIPVQVHSVIVLGILLFVFDPSLIFVGFWGSASCYQKTRRTDSRRI